jgi:hypothetical protein
VSLLHQSHPLQKNWLQELLLAPHRTHLLQIHPPQEPPLESNRNQMMKQGHFCLVAFQNFQLQEW